MESEDTQCKSKSTFWICFKNLIPRPFPRDAPSISPGMSAIIFLLGNTPRLGERVVK